MGGPSADSSETYPFRDTSRTCGTLCRKTPIGSLYHVDRMRDTTAAWTARPLAGRTFRRNASGKALAPFVRVARGMKYGVDRDHRLRLLVEHGVWKPTYQGATVALVNDRVHPGLTPDAFHTRIDRTQELLTQSGSAAFVPDVGFCNVQLGFRSHHQLNGHSGQRHSGRAN